MISQQSAISYQLSAKKSNLPIRSCHCERSEAISKCEIPRGVYPEPSDKILRYAQNDRRRRARNDKLQVLSNQKGIALVMVLVLSAIALAIMAGLIYMLTSGTQISGIQKRYKTALEAGVGGAEVSYQVIGARGNPNIPYISFTQTATDPCLTAKLNTRTSSANWVNCDYAKASSLRIDPDDSATYDWSFDLGASPTYRVYAKIVDTVEGNSGGDEGLLKHGVVSSGSGEVAVMSIPYLYTIEVDAQDSANPAERAKLSILYQY
jgi:hypothetical protein